MTTAAWIVTSTPSVAITRTSELAGRNGRMITQWVSAPRKADQATPTIAESEERPAVLGLQFPLHEHAGDRGGAEREVQDAGAAVDHDQALGREGVQGADAQSQQREPDDLVHLPPLAGRPLCVAKHQSSRRRSDGTTCMKLRKSRTHRAANIQRMRSYETARPLSFQYRARTAFLSGLPTGVSGSAST